MKKMKLNELSVSSFITRSALDDLMGGADAAPSVIDAETGPYDGTTTIRPNKESFSCCYFTQTGCNE